MSTASPPRSLDRRPDQRRSTAPRVSGRRHGFRLLARLLPPSERPRHFAVPALARSFFLLHGTHERELSALPAEGLLFPEHAGVPALLVRDDFADGRASFT